MLIYEQFNKKGLNNGINNSDDIINANDQQCLYSYNLENTFFIYKPDN